MSSKLYFIAALVLLLGAFFVALYNASPDQARSTPPDDPTSQITTRITAETTPDPPPETGEQTVTPRLLGEGSGDLINVGTVREDGPTTPTRTTPSGEGITLTVSRLDIRNVPVPSGSTQRQLDREGILRMSGSGLPWQAGSNTFIVGHTLGYQGTKFPYAFYDLEKLRPGDEIVLKDDSGGVYRYRVFDEMTVRPEDYWVTYPDRDGRTIVSLQNCVPIPEFDMRLVVQAELVE